LPATAKKRKVRRDRQARDLIILSQNIFDIKPNRIGATKSFTTIVAGGWSIKQIQSTGGAMKFRAVLLGILMIAMAVVGP